MTHSVIVVVIVCAQNASLKETVQDLEVQRDDNTKEIRHFRDTLQTTVSHLLPELYRAQLTLFSCADGDSEEASS